MTRKVGIRSYEVDQGRAKSVVRNRRHLRLASEVHQDNNPEDLGEEAQPDDSSPGPVTEDPCSEGPPDFPPDDPAQTLVSSSPGPDPELRTRSGRTIRKPSTLSDFVPY